MGSGEVVSRPTATADACRARSASSRSSSTVEIERHLAGSFAFAGPGTASTGMLARDQLLARPCLAGDEDRDVGGGDLLHLAEDLLHPRRRAEDLAEADLLDARLQRPVVELELVDQKRVAHQQRGLGGEDREDLQ